MEQSERNGNAQLAREVEFSLLRELAIGQNIILAHEFVQKTFVDNGMCADVCVHDKGDGNPHCHVLLTMRQFNIDSIFAPKSRRINTLTVYLEQCDIRKQHRAVYQKYTKLDPKKRKACAEKHAEEIRLYKEAADYIKGVMNGRAQPPPVKKWKAELATLTAERYALYDKYYRLDDELKSIEALRRRAESIIRDKPQREQRTRARDMAL